VVSFAAIEFTGVEVYGCVRHANDSAELRLNMFGQRFQVQMAVAEDDTTGMHKHNAVRQRLNFKF